MKKVHKIAVLGIFLALFWLNTLPYSSALSLELLENTDTCIYQPENDKDYCYSIYKFCDDSFNPSLVNFIFKKGNEQEYRQTLKDLDFETEIENLGDKCYKIKIEAHKNPFQNIDNILCYDGNCFYEYAWWNTSFYVKLPINASTTTGNVDDFLVLLNDTSGFMFNGSRNLVRCNYSVTSTRDVIGWLYINPDIGYACIDENQNERVTMIIDEGNETSYGETESRLVGWYHLDSVNDLSAFNQDLTNSNAELSGFGKVGHSYDFSSGDYMHTTDSIPLSLTGSFTIVAWFYPTYTNAMNWGLAKSDYSADIGYSIRMGTGSTVSEFFVSNDGTTGGRTSYSVTGTTPNQWVMITFTFNGSFLSTYYNKTYMGGTAHTGGIHDTDADFCIGCRYQSGSPTTGFNGTIDDVMVFNETLTTDEIFAIYDNAIETHQFAPLGDVIFLNETQPEIAFVSPTPTNVTINRNYAYFNLSSSDKNLLFCNIVINGTNESMNYANNLNFYLNKTGLANNVNYFYYASCNDTDGLEKNTTEYFMFVSYTVTPTTPISNITIQCDICDDLPIKTQYCNENQLVTVRERYSCAYGDVSQCVITNQTDITICNFGCEGNLSIYGAECVPYSTFEQTVILWIMAILIFLVIFIIPYKLRRTKKNKGWF